MELCIFFPEFFSLLPVSDLLYKGCGGRSGIIPGRSLMSGLRLASVALTLILFSCERVDEETSMHAPTKLERSEVGSERVVVEIGSGRSGVEEELTREGFVERIHEASDEEVDDFLDAIREEADQVERRRMQTVLYEETGLRSPMVRLPMLLELARLEDCDPGLKTTMMAELTVAVGVDHGASWGDWALALQEHLQVSEGLFSGMGPGDGG